MKTSHAIRLVALLYWKYRSAWRKRMVKLQAMINQGSVTIAQSSRLLSAVQATTLVAGNPMRFTSLVY